MDLAPRAVRRRPAAIARLAALVVVASATAVLPGGSASAADGLVTSVTMVSESGDYIGAGTARLFHPGGGVVSLSGNPSNVSVYVSGGTSDDYFTMSIAAPEGEALRVGEYTGAERTPFRTAGRPGLEVSGSGRGCNTVRGRFTVLDIAVTDATVQRLHLLYEQHCEGREPALFGEIRYRVPADDGGDAFVAPSQVDWPMTYPGARAREVPVTVVNEGPGPIAVGTPTISGTGAASYSVASNDCTSPLPAGASCVVDVRFVPTAAGRHLADLTVSLGTGSDRMVRLQGEGDPRHTSWEMRGEPGEHITGGQSYSWTPATAAFSAYGSETRVGVGVTTDSSSVLVEFAPGSGDVLLPGVTYDNARRRSDGSPDPGLTVTGFGRACNATTGWFTVHDIATGAGRLDRFSATFEHRCDDGRALVGSIAYQASDPAQPLPHLVMPEPEPEPEPEPSFTDIAGTTHELNIEVIAYWQIAGGYPDGTFRPGQPVTRGQMATFLARAFDLPSAPPAGFSDSAGDTHEAAIDALAASGIAGGYPDGTFRPTAPVTRGQMATFLDRAFGFPDAAPGWFSDTSGDVHADAIDRIAAAGIAGGFPDGTYRPADAVSRGQMATFLVRSLSE